MRILILYIILVIIFSGSNKKEKNDYYRLNLKGKVKSIYESVDSDNTAPASITKYAKSSSEMTFDERGSVTRYTTFIYKSRDSVLLVTTIAYNENGNKIQSTSIGKNNIIFSKIDYKYALDGKLTSEIEYFAPNHLKRKVFSYDDMGNIKEAGYFKSDGDPSISLYPYDQKNSKKEEDYLEKNGELAGRVVFAYDNNGNVLEEKHLNPKDSLILKITNKYNAHGDLKQSDQFDTNLNLIGQFIISYDRSDNIIKKDISESKGNSKHKESRRYNYEYDKTGNWLKETVFNYDTLLSITSREIAYY